jgi:hypothetical protein
MTSPTKMLAWFSGIGVKQTIEAASRPGVTGRAGWINEEQ